ncbi:MAG: hypothetical protein M1816_006120 [Peltula sp. TS41687]|nr:MAG: hypothetical protein M1816_006120 [Peltula sp. TS41687]
MLTGLCDTTGFRYNSGARKAQDGSKMEVMDYEMEEPRPPSQGPPRSYLNCPYFAGGPHVGPPMNNITGTIQGQNTLPPFFPTNFQRAGFAGPSNPPVIPPYMPGANNQFPQVYEFRNSYQGTFEAQRAPRARSAIRQNGTQNPAQPGSMPGIMARHDGLERFNHTGTSTMSSQAPPNPTVHAQPPLYPSGLGSPSRHEHMYPGSSVAPGASYHQPTTGPPFPFNTYGANNNNNINTTRPLASAMDPTRYGMTNEGHSTQDGLSTINPRAPPQPAHRQLPNIFPGSNVANGNNTNGNYNGHLPAPVSQFHNPPPRWEGPARTRVQRRPNGPSNTNNNHNNPGPAPFYPPNLFSGTMRNMPESDPSGRLRDHVTGNIDTTPSIGDRPLLNAEDDPRVAAFIDYVGRGGLQQRQNESHRNESVTDSERPSRDFSEFLNHLRRSVAAGDYREIDARVRAATASSNMVDRTDSSPAAGPQPAGEPQLTASQMQLRARQHDLTILMQRAREMSTRGMNISYTAAREMHTRRATARAIAGLVKVEIETLDEEDRSCSICMEPFGEPEPTEGKIEYPVRMPCGHVYGLTCLKTWLKEHCTCPSCRRKVESEFRSYSSFAPDLSQTGLGRDRNGGAENDSDEPSRRARRRRTNYAVQVDSVPIPPRQADITAARTPDRLGSRQVARAHEGVPYRSLGPSGLSRRWVPSPEPAESGAGESPNPRANNTGIHNTTTVGTAETTDLTANVAPRTYRPEITGHFRGRRMRVMPSLPAPTNTSTASGTMTGNAARTRRTVRTRGGPSGNLAGNNNGNRMTPRSPLARMESTMSESPTRGRTENESGSDLTPNPSPTNNNTVFRNPSRVRARLEASQETLRRIGEQLDAISRSGALQNTYDPDILLDEPLMTFSDDEEGEDIE